MTDAEILTNLEQVVQQLGMTLRYESGDFKGGICRIENDTVFIVNKKLMESQKIALICGELAQMDLSHIFMMPAIREMIEKSVQQHGLAEE